jgi:hypothetical protein
VGEISFHLGIDWLPSLPPPFRSSVFGWPPLLIDTLAMNATGAELLCLNAQAARSERQWKTVLSWMLGIAGARQFLKQERYRWVAPMSAFYPNSTQDVDLSNWHPSFPRSVVQASSQPDSTVRLRPDYIAIRPLPTGQFEWAVVEAKGTTSSLTRLSICPPEWRDQVRNIVVTVENQSLTVPRHLVVATRVNPNASRPMTRRIQVRAWNNRIPAEEHSLPQAAAVEIVAAHLFGLFVGLRLPDFARAIRRSVQARRTSAERHLNNKERELLRRDAENAEENLARRARRPFVLYARQADAQVDVETERGTLEVDLSTPLMTLTRQLCRAETVETAAGAVQAADDQLNLWETSRRAEISHVREIVMPFGVELRVPAEFEPRRPTDNPKSRRI